MGIILWLIPCFIFAQGPITGFMPGAGNLDLAVTYGYDSYDIYLFGDERQSQDLVTQSASLFVEYGSSERFSLLLNIPYIWIDKSNQGLQDGSFYLKFQNLHQRKKSGSLSLITAIGLTFPLSNYNIDTETPIGQKNTVFNARLNMQYGGDKGFFFSLQSGLDFQLIPDALASLPTLFRVGYGGRWIYLDAWMENVYTFNAGVDDRIQGGSGSNWWRVGGTVYVPILPQLGAVANVAHFLSGRNIGLSTRWGAGLVIKIGKDR